MRTLVLLLMLASLLVVSPASADPVPETEATCVPTNGGGMDYHSEACVDPDNKGCRAWHTSPEKQVCLVPV